MRPVLPRLDQRRRSIARRRWRLDRSERLQRQPGVGERPRLRQSERSGQPPRLHEEIHRPGRQPEQRARPARAVALATQLETLPLPLGRQLP